MTVSRSDEELMRRCAEGDRAAFTELAARYRPRLAAMARRWLGEADAADDAAQEVLIAAFGQRRRYRSQGRFAAWLFTLAANHLRDVARARARRLGALGRLAGAAKGEAAEGSVLDGAVLWDALGGLPPSHRAALLLHHLYGFGHAEIAGLFGVAPGTVRSWTTRAGATVRKRLEVSGISPRRKRR